jgi:hypothetical protein
MKSRRGGQGLPVTPGEKIQAAWDASCTEFVPATKLGERYDPKTQTTVVKLRYEDGPHRGEVVELVKGSPALTPPGHAT